MFGGIETTEGMICNAVLHLLGQPAARDEVAADERLAANAVEESLRLEPAAAVVDRYATADVRLGGAAIRRGDPVTVSLAGAGRDPAFFPEPDRFDLRRANARQNLAFAHGPHFCLGAHLARAEARAAIVALLRGLPGLRLDPARRAAPRGVVFRKPPELQRAVGRARVTAGQATWIDRLASPSQYPVIVVTGAGSSAPAPSVTNSGAKCSVVGCA